MTATHTVLPIDRAEAYRAGAWCTPIGLPAGKKSPPEVGFTGEKGRFSSPADIARWRAEGMTNLGGRLMKSVLGIDRDFYKEGTRETFAALEAELGALPPTWQITSRDDGSGIGLYRVDPALQSNWPGQVCPNVELIRSGHRYCALPGSVHPEGRVYHFVKPDGTVADLDEIPRLIDLPYLPDAWVEALTGVRTGGENVEGHRARGSRAEQHQERRKARQWIRSLPSGELCRYVGAIAADAMAAARREEGAAYDHTRDAVLALLRAGEVGHPGVKDILTRVRDIYVETIEDRADEALAIAEFNRFTYGGVTKILADPSKRQGSGCDCVQDTSNRHPLDPSGPSSWAPHDLERYLDPDYEGEPPPSCCFRTDGKALFYAARTNMVWGESGGMKTWVAAFAVLQTIRSGRCAVAVDFESNGGVWVSRLLALGLTSDEIRAHFVYVHPTDPLAEAEREDLIRLLDSRSPAIVVVDGITDALGLHDYELNSNSDWAAFDRRLLKPIAQRGPTVVSLDHAVKNPENRNGNSIGAQHKRASVTGASFEVKVISKFGRGKTGRISLTVHKDRPGYVDALGPSVAEFTFTANPDGTSIEATCEAPDAPTLTEAGEHVPTFLMQRVSEYVELNEGQTNNGIASAVSGNRKHLIRATGFLVKYGYLTTEPGPNRSVRHYFVKAYRDGDPLVVPSGSSVVPGSSKNHTGAGGSVVPSPYRGEPLDTTHPPDADGAESHHRGGTTEVTTEVRL